VRLLLQKKANPGLRDRSGKTAFDYANQSRQPETIRLLQAAR
jgi:ankyrin repeat protein